MLVGFHTVNSNDNCGICLDSMENCNDVIAHDGVDGDKHPWHKECIKTWMFSSGNNKCTHCPSLTDVSSLLSWKEKAVVKLQPMKEAAIEGIKVVISGTVLGLGVTILSGIQGVAATALGIYTVEQGITHVLNNAPSNGLIVFGGTVMYSVIRILPESWL